jgi:hypothetical protein
MQMMKVNSSEVFFNPKFFEVRHSGAIDADVKCVRPIVRYPQGNVTLKYNVGTRGNGVDQPRWPEDLLTEIVV